MREVVTAAGFTERRLVDIAEADTKLCQFIQNRGLDPTAVTDFNNQGVVGEAMVKTTKVVVLLHGMQHMLILMQSQLDQMRPQNSSGRVRHKLNCRMRRSPLLHCLRDELAQPIVQWDTDRFLANEPLKFVQIDWTRKPLLAESGQDAKRDLHRQEVLHTSTMPKVLPGVNSKY
jgi:hypothetical protein